jgi:heme exporter protein CcmD
MIGMGEHTEFIIAAYLGVGLGLLALIGWTAIASRRTRARLKDLGDRRG